MKATLIVRDDKDGEWKNDKGDVIKTRKLDLVDMSKPVFVRTLAYSMTAEEQAKHAGRLDGKTVTFGVSDIVIYDGKASATLKGSILEVSK